MSKNILNHSDSLAFITAGKSTFTVLNPNTGNRFTYFVEKSKHSDLFFVKVLTGPDNNRHYSYIGILKDGLFKITDKSKFNNSANSVKVFCYVLNKLKTNTLDSFIEILHEGKCGKCGKKLTTPISIKSGYGPDCFKNLKSLKPSLALDI